MIPHDELISQWENDCKMDKSRLEEEMFRQPILHSKYLRYLQEYKVKIRKLGLKYDKVRQLKMRYYNGELTQEELSENGWKQYQYVKPSKTGMESLLSADSDLQIILEQVEYIKIMIETCDSIIKEIHSRGYLLKSILENRKFEAGI